MSTDLEFHPVADIFPMMSDLEFSGLVDDIKANGLREPVWLHRDGRIIDGRNRYRACRQAGIEPITRTYDGPDGELVRFVISLNLHRRHLDSDQRAVVAARVEEYEQGRPGKDANLHVKRSDAAELLRVSERSVAAAKKVLASNDENLIAEAEKGRKDGGISISAAAAAAQLGEEQRRVFLERSRQEKTARVARQMQRDEFEDREMVARLSGEGYEPSRERDAHVGHNSGENEWYTPVDYILAAKAVMGAIDLDPASSHTANGVIAAERFYSERDDGLRQDWAGRVWMNPPYAQPLVSQFCEKLAKSYASGQGDVTEACALVNNATETGWFQTLAEAASAMCFPRGRIKFWHPSREAIPLQGQAVIYLGTHVDEFRTAFLPFGFVVTL